MGGGEGGPSQNYPCFKFIIFMDSVKSSPAFLKSQFETLHICYRCSEKEHVPFQIGKKTLLTKLQSYQTWAPLISAREIDLLPSASARAVSGCSRTGVLFISGRVKSFRI